MASAEAHANCGLGCSQQLGRLLGSQLPPVRRCSPAQLPPRPPAAAQCGVLPPSCPRSLSKEEGGDAGGLQKLDTAVLVVCRVWPLACAPGLQHPTGAHWHTLHASAVKDGPSLSACPLAEAGRRCMQHVCTRSQSDAGLDTTASRRGAGAAAHVAFSPNFRHSSCCGILPLPCTPPSLTCNPGR